MSISISKLTFAWHSLTDDQQTRINLKYDLVNSIKAMPKGGCKRNIYRAIADKYCYTMETVEYIAGHSRGIDLKK